MSDLPAYLALGGVLVVIPLMFTVVIEAPIAAAFRVGRNGVLAVMLVDVVTNPLLSVVMLTLYGLGVGFRGGDSYAWFAYSRSFWPVMLLLETAVVIVEWRLLRWALKHGEVGPQRLLALSITMNAASFAAGLIVSSRLFT